MIENTSKSVVSRIKFGKRIEYWVMSLLLKEGFDVFVPLVDDHGIDAIIRGPGGGTIELQIKGRSKDVADGDAALFAAISHSEVVKNYYFLFYAERLDMMWFMSSKDFVEQANKNKKGKHIGSYSIWFNGKRKGVGEFPYDRFNKWLMTKDKRHDFSAISQALRRL